MVPQVMSSILCGEELNCESSHGDGGISFPSMSTEFLALMADKEALYLPNADYRDRLNSGDLSMDGRNEAVDWILKLHAHFGFGHVCAALAINYLDRFLSSYRLPSKPWMMQLISVTCVLLAAKVEETKVPLCVDIQIKQSRFVFEARTIQRMELLVLNALKWRMHAVTPFSFLHYFIAKIIASDLHLKFFVSLSIQTIFRVLRGIEFLEFRPSEIAAAVAIEVLGADADQAIRILNFNLEKERVKKCVKMTRDVRRRDCRPRSPTAVLDAKCFGCNSHEDQSSPKRRKVRCSEV